MQGRKTLYMIGGTMGAGKTSVGRCLKTKLDNSVFLDGDWCWDAHPFKATDETKRMVLENICFLLNQFIRCTEYGNIIFCWVMHEQNIIDSILAGIDKEKCDIKAISLMCNEKSLTERLSKDVACGIRTPNIIERSIARIPCYDKLSTVKIQTDGKSIEKVADEIAVLT